MIAVCLHGFLRTGVSMLYVRNALLKLGYKQVLCPSFALQFGTLEDHGAKLHQIIDTALQKNAASQVDIVTYSMGGLLFRASLAHKIPYRRAVMIAPPNKGARMAELIKSLLPIHKLGWDPLHQLCPQIPIQLPEPNINIQVGIVAGIKGDGIGYNPFLGEDNDGKVCLSETYLHRKVEHLVVQGRHPMLIMNQMVAQEIQYFFNHATFNSPSFHQSHHP